MFVARENFSDGGSLATITGSTHIADAALTGSAAATATGGIEGVAVATLGNAVGGAELEMDLELMAFSHVGDRERKRATAGGEPR